MKKLLFVFLVVLLIFGCSKTDTNYRDFESTGAVRPDGKKTMYLATALTGGGSGALDAFDITGAAAPNTYDLVDGDSAIVTTLSGTTGNSYQYVFDADGTDAESSPTVIRPDDYATAGVWRLVVFNINSIQQAQADGSTLGLASFAANDFNDSAGNITIDYTNGQAAASGVKGFLTAADWAAFNSKLGNSDGIFTATVLTGGTATALDAIPIASLADGYYCIVRVGQSLYLYLFDADSTDAESSPNRIRPDDFSTEGVWEMQLYIADGSIQLSSLPETLPIADGDGTGTARFGFATSDNRVFTLPGDADATLAILAAQTFTGFQTMGAGGVFQQPAASATDGYYDGEVRTFTVDSGQSETSFGQVYHVDTDGELIVADGDVASQGSMPAIGLAVETGTGSKKVLLRGLICETDWNWTVGGTVYVSDDPSTTEGLTQTALSTSGDTVQLVGIAVTADCIEVNMGGYVWVEVP